MDVFDDVEDKLHLFNSLFPSKLAQHVPIRTFKVRGKPNPCITDDIRADENERLLARRGKYRIYLNKRRIWDKKVNKRRLRITRKNTKLFHNDKGVRSHR